MRASSSIDSDLRNIKIDGGPDDVAVSCRSSDVEAAERFRERFEDRWAKWLRKVDDHEVDAGSLILAGLLLLGDGLDPETQR